MSFLLSKKRGFTIVEVSVAITIVAILASVVIANVQEGRKRARDAQRLSDLGQMQLSLRTYRDVNSSDYPASSGEALVSTGGVGAYLTSSLPTLPSNPSGGSYYYDSSYVCNGSSRVVLLAQGMERANAGNFVSQCGSTFTVLMTGVTPTASSYIIILK